jgi:hypothetical protein
MDLTIEQFSESISLTKTDITTVASIASDCSFWKTKHENIYITDYDILWNECIRYEDKVNILKDKGIVIIFYRKQGLFLYEKISAELLSDKQLMLEIIDEFKAKVESYK